MCSSFKDINLLILNYYRNKLVGNGYCTNSYMPPLNRINVKE